MPGLIPGDLNRFLAAVRVASSRGPVNAKLFVEDMIQSGKMCTPGGTIGSLRSCSSPCKIEGRPCTRSCVVIPLLSAGGELLAAAPKELV